MISPLSAAAHRRFLVLMVLVVVLIGGLTQAAPPARAAGGDAADEFFFYRSTDGAYRYYETKANGSLGTQIVGGTGYSTGWSSITAVDLDGDGQDELFFYRSTDGAYRYYDVKPNGSLGVQLSGGTGYSTGWTSITAVDLDGDNKDEFFFYRATDGAYRYYKMNSNGSVGAQLSGGTGYSTGWSAITAVDLDGDRKDEFFFYRKSDGAYRYYGMKPNGSLGNQLSGGTGYSTGWSAITAVNIDGNVPPPPPPPPPPALPKPSNCHPSYPTVCIPYPPPDLNCPQISHRNFKVVGTDPHGFDSDNDGVGCET